LLRPGGSENIVQRVEAKGFSVLLNKEAVEALCHSPLDSNITRKYVWMKMYGQVMGQHFPARYYLEN